MSLPFAKSKPQGDVEKAENIEPRKNRHGRTVWGFEIGFEVKSYKVVRKLQPQRQNQGGAANVMPTANIAPGATVAPVARLLPAADLMPQDEPMDDSDGSETSSVTSVGIYCRTPPTGDPQGPPV